MLWTAIGLLGATVGYSNLRDSKDTLDRLEEINGRTLAQYRVMRLLAYGHYRNDLFRLAKHLTITAVGILAMVLPPIHGTNSVAPVAYVITAGLFTIVLLLLMASTLDRRQRSALEDLEREEKVEHSG